MNRKQQQELAWRKHQLGMMRSQVRHLLPHHQSQVDQMIFVAIIDVDRQFEEARSKHDRA